MAIRETMRKPAGRPVALAFSLFTNDDPRRAPELAAWARRSLDGLPAGSCAIWATIARPKVAGVSYAQANTLLEQVGEEEPRIVVVPWARATKLHPEWLRKDRVHATPEGYAARAQLFAEAAQSCGLER
jgi:lysophospholipase L1-like esterase